MDPADRLRPCAVRDRRRRDEAGSDPDEADAVSRRRSRPPSSTRSSGTIAWNGANLPPFAAKNVAKTPLVGGQWRLKDGGGYDLVITDNKTAPNIPTGGKMEPIA